MTVTRLLRCFALLIRFFAWLMVVLHSFPLLITKKTLSLLMSTFVMSLTKSRVRLNGLLRRIPELQPLIDDFGLMLRAEYDERSSNAMACFLGLYRFHSETRYDPKNSSSHYRPINPYAGFGYSSPCIIKVYPLTELLSSHVLIQGVLF